MAENAFDILTRTDTLDNPALKEKREEMLKNTDRYSVQGGDTIASIAKNCQIENYADLIALNRLMGHSLKIRGKSETNVLIKAWDQIFVPKDLRKFQADIEGVRKISESMVMNEQVTRGDTKALSKEINERIFPGFRQSLGMNRLNDGLLGNMRSDLRLPGPRQVDPKFQIDASCAHYYRQDIRSAFNIGDMPKSWKKFMNTGNIDAWELPIELLGLKSNDGKSEFIQKANFMDVFDTSKFGAKISPIFVEKQGEYARKMVELNEYLEKNPNAVNTAIPVYYRYSNYQLRGIDQARVGGEKHYNTHMMRYVGSTPVTFPAYEWGETHPDGTITSFGGDKKRLEKEVLNLKGMLVGERTAYETHKKTLLENVKDEFPKHHFTIDKKLTDYSKGAKTEEERVALKKEMESLFDSGNIELIKTRLSKIIHWPVDDENAKLLVHWQKNKRKVAEGLKRIEEVLENKKPEEYPYFNPEDFSALLSSSKRISGVFTIYNDAIKRVNSLGEQIITANKKVEEFKDEEKNREKAWKEARAEIARITPELQKAKTEHEKVKRVFLESLDEWKNPELKEWFGGFDAVAKKHFGPSGGSRADALIQGFQSGKLGDDFRVQMRMTEADFNYLKSLFLKREKIRKNIASIQARLGIASNPVPEIHIDDIGKSLGTNNRVTQSLAAYNASAAKVNGHMNDISVREEKMKIKKEIPAVDYLLNFLQQRADYGTSAVKSEGRKQILEGLTMYAGAVKMKVNGKSVNIAEELKKLGKDRTKVSPEDTIEFSGPVMSDGFHMQNIKDPVERAKMQGRQRFFFELLATQTFFPSETLEPTQGSLMHRTSFREATDGVKTKGEYSLNRGDTLEHTIKRLAPVYERAEFDKLDPNAPDYQKKYNGLIQKYYALQIKGLQMLGYMQSEDVLNPGAIKINQGIPYFDPTDLSKQFSGYIAGVKTKRKEGLVETAKYREFINVQTLPGDTVGTFYGRIANYTKEYSSHFTKYPNLALVPELNDFLKKKFLERLLKVSITKVDDKDITNMLQEGKVRAGYNFVFRLTDIDQIMGGLREISHTPDISDMLKPWDNAVINATTSMKQNQNLLRLTLFVETYEYENGKWYMPNGADTIVKDGLQSLGLRKIHSFSDFQIREILWLRVGFWKEWITKEQLVRACTQLSDPRIKKIIDDLKKNRPSPDDSSFIKWGLIKSAILSDSWSAIDEDIARVERLQTILQKKNITPEDYQEISAILKATLRIDIDKTGKTIVGKVIGASLANDNYNIHSQKLNGELIASGEDPRSFSGDPEKMARYEKTLFFSASKGNMMATLGCAENYLYRIIEQTGIVEKAGNTLRYNPVNLEKGRSVDYGTSVFLRHMASINEQVVQSKTLLTSNIHEAMVITKILSFETKIQNVSEEHQQRLRDINSKLTDPKENNKTALLKQKNDSFVQQDTDILKAIYALVADAELREALTHFSVGDTQGIDSSLLPTEAEFTKNDAFRYPFFGHARKSYKFQKEAMLLKSSKSEKKPV